MKGIILAAGNGSRLYPMTKPVCKPLLPIFDKPMIYYPLSTLLSAGVKEIVIITSSSTSQAFRDLLGYGNRFGISIEYAVQHVARGIADALVVAENFIGQDNCCLILGDNVFHGNTDFAAKLAEASRTTKGATIFGCPVADPRPFGVVEFDGSGRAVSIEEKPQRPKSNYIVPGLYFYDNDVIALAKEVKPSARGELEITDVNNAYLQRGLLRVLPLQDGFTWFDAGTAESLLDSAVAIRAIQAAERRIICCPEEVAFRQGFINADLLAQTGQELKGTAYGQYLLSVATGERP